LLASGCIDLVAESDLKVHDVMALIPIVEGAGGLITDWNGDAVRERFNGSILAACTPELHGQALAILKSELDHHSAGLTDSVARA
jgi:myo-inositol-1(or 4)-monophosphatase